MSIRSDENAERLEHFSNRILETIWESNPVGATVLGIHKYDNTLGDVSTSAVNGFCHALRDSIAALQTDIDPSLLDADQELNRRLAIALAHSNLIMLDQQRSWENNPSTYSSQAVWGCLSLLMRNPGSPQDTLHLMLARMREIPEMLSISKESIQNPASVFVQIALGVNMGAVSFFRDELPAIAAGSVLEGDIRAAGVNVITAFESYDEWLRNEVLPNAHGNFAVGSNVYEQMLLREHCLPFTASDLTRLGTRVLHETRERIAEVARAIDPSASWPDLISGLKREHPSKEGLVDAYRVAFESARDFIVERDLASIPEHACLTVGCTPEVERNVMPYAAYFPPAPFGDDKTGCLWVTPIDETASKKQQEAQLLEHCIYSIPIIALHEGFPGHHLQLTRAMDSPYLLRRQMLNSLLMEGWALYCEELMQDEGFYADPRIELFQLKDMLWRACRVIIDVGIHTGGMTFDEAVEMLVDKACIDEACAAAEVRRYAMSPTQPMTYVVGKLMLLDLRDQMKRKLGNRFNLKEFHDEFLSYGSIPPPLIIERMTGDAECGRSTAPILRSA